MYLIDLSMLTLMTIEYLLQTINGHDYNRLTFEFTSLFFCAITLFQETHVGNNNNCCKFKVYWLHMPKLCDVRSSIKKLLICKRWPH